MPVAASGMWGGDSGDRAARRSSSIRSHHPEACPHPHERPLQFESRGTDCSFSDFRSQRVYGELGEVGAASAHHNFPQAARQFVSVMRRTPGSQPCAHNLPCQLKNRKRNQGNLMASEVAKVLWGSVCGPVCGHRLLLVLLSKDLCHSGSSEAPSRTWVQH